MCVRHTSTIVLYLIRFGAESPLTKKEFYIYFMLLEVLVRGTFLFE